MDRRDMDIHGHPADLCQSGHSRLFRCQNQHQHKELSDTSLGDRKMSPRNCPENRGSVGRTPREVPWQAASSGVSSFGRGLGGAGSATCDHLRPAPLCCCEVFELSENPLLV